MNWQQRKTWSDAYIPMIKQIVGPRLLEVAPHEWDVKRAAEFDSVADARAYLRKLAIADIFRNFHDVRIADRRFWEQAE